MLNWYIKLRPNNSTCDAARVRHNAEHFLEEKRYYDEFEGKSLSDSEKFWGGSRYVFARPSFN